MQNSECGVRNFIPIVHDAVASTPNDKNWPRRVHSRSNAPLFLEQRRLIPDEGGWEVAYNFARMVNE